MAGYGRIWQDMVGYGQIWRDTSRYRKKIVRTRAYRRRLADVQKAFSRLFQQNVHRYTHGWPLRTVRPASAQTRTTMWMSLLQPARRTESPCCLCPVSGHALRAVQPASESACSFLFLQPSVHSFCTPSVHLLYTFCTPSVHLLHILYISGRSTNPIQAGFTASLEIARMLQQKSLAHARFTQQAKRGRRLLIEAVVLTEAVVGSWSSDSQSEGGWSNPRAPWCSPRGPSPSHVVGCELCEAIFSRNR